MNKALIINEDSVTIIDIVNWENINRDYIKIFTDSGKTLVCSSVNIRLDLGREVQVTDEELVREILNKDMKINYYEGKSCKLSKHLWFMLEFTLHFLIVLL